MKNKRKGLGRGLSSILRNPEINITSKGRGEIDHSTTETKEIEINKISQNPFQPRHQFDISKLDELAHSIKKLGLIQPITVRRLNNEKYQLISGERRLKASKIANKDKILAYIRVANDQQMLEMALVENIQREDLNPIEIAMSYQRLITECKLTQEQCSDKIGKKRSTIANFLGLLKLPEEIQIALKDKKIRMSMARALINIEDKEKQLNIFYDSIKNGLSVREVEQIVKEFRGRSYKRISKIRNTTQDKLPFAIQQMSHNLSKYINQEIEIKKNNQGNGKMIIPFKSEEDLKEIFEKLNHKD